jgi:hypothetical protein
MKKFFFILSILFCARLINSAEIPETTTLLPNEEEESEPSLKGYRLVEATPLTADDLEFLRTLDETVPEDVLDFWSTPVKIEEAVPILVHPELLPHVEEAFQVESLFFSASFCNFKCVTKQIMRSRFTKSICIDKIVKKKRRQYFVKETSQNYT